MGNENSYYLVPGSELNAIGAAIRDKKGTSTEYQVSEMADAISGISTGGGTILPTLTSPASASHILSGKQAINSSGNVITGTITTNTSSDLDVNGDTVTVPTGYYASEVSKSVGTTNVSLDGIKVYTNNGVSSDGYKYFMVEYTQPTSGYITAGNMVDGGYKSDIKVKTANDVTTSGLKVTIPAGYYESTVTKTVVSDVAWLSVYFKGTLKYNIPVPLYGGSAGKAMFTIDGEMHNGNTPTIDSVHSIDPNNSANTLYGTSSIKLMNSNIYYATWLVTISGITGENRTYTVDIEQS